MKKHDVELTEEKQTLFITLYAKALDFTAKHSILHDEYAFKLLKSVNYNFEKHEAFGTNVMVIRAKHFDDFVDNFITKHANAVVVYLGCGLDTRAMRIKRPSTVNWYDVDYPEVIELRKNFFTDDDTYKMIASSVTETNWLPQIPTNKPTVIIAEGLLEYLRIDEVKALLHSLTTHFNHGEIIFDVMNSFAIQSGKQKLKETTGAIHKWAVDKLEEVDKLNPALKRIESLSVFESPYIKQLSFKSRMLYSFFSIVPAFKNMIRILRYTF